MTTGDVPARGGRLADSERSVVAVDIGATKIAVAIVGSGGEIRKVARRRTPTTALAVLDAASQMVLALAATEQVQSIGVAAPGVIDPVAGSVLSATEILPQWAGTNVRAELEKRTGYAVAVDNDVRAMAFAEARLGAAASRRRVLFVAVGTGVGGALTDGGTLVHGPHYSTGEIAHLLVPARGPIACGCGRYDHLEAVVAGPAITAAWCQRTGLRTEDLADVAAHLGRSDSLALVAQAVIEEAAQILGRTLGGFLQAVDLDAIVLGGGVSQIGAPFLDPVAAALRAEIPDTLRHVPLLPAAFGSEAQLVGAALLAVDGTGARGADRSPSLSEAFRR